MDKPDGTGSDLPGSRARGIGVFSTPPSGRATPPAADRAERGMRRATARPWARELLILAGFLAAGIAATWPRPAYILGSLPHGVDEASYVWSLWWVAHQLTHLANPWVTHYLAAPGGLPLGYDTLMPLPGLVLAPVTLAFGPSASFTLLAILTPGLAGYAMFRVARLWLPTFTGAIAAGAFFGLSGMFAWQDWYHINIAAGTVFMPLALEGAIRLRRDPTIRRGLVLGVVIGACVLVNQESAVMAVILAALALVPWLTSVPSAARIRALAVSVVTAAVVATPQVLPMVQQASSGLTATHELARQYEQFAGELPSMFAPSTRVADYGLSGLASIYTSHTPRGESLATFGVVLTTLALLGLVVGWRRRGTGRLGLLWLASTLLALGPTLYVAGHQYVPLPGSWHGAHVSLLMPYTWFVRLPGLSAFREADRLAFLGLAAAALLAGAAIEWLRGHAKPLLAVAVVLGAMEAGWPGSPQRGTMPTTMTALDAPIAADHSNSIVVDVPYGIRGGVRRYGHCIAGMSLVLATADGHPRAVSYTSWVPPQTIAAARRHPFYTKLVAAQRGHHNTPAQLAAARSDAAQLGANWLILWQPRQPGSALASYLAATGFRFQRRADGASLYRRAATHGHPARLPSWRGAGSRVRAAGSGTCDG
jgi:hypothetical protein